MALAELLEEEKTICLTQYDFFESSELSNTKAEVKSLKERGDRARKGLFARYNELTKIVEQLQKEVDELKSNNPYPKPM